MYRNVFPTCKWYFCISPTAVHRQSSRLTEIHKLSPEDADSDVSRFIFLSIQRSITKMTLKSACDLDVFFLHPKLLHAKLYGSRVDSSQVTRNANDLFTYGGYPRMGYK